MQQPSSCSVLSMQPTSKHKLSHSCSCCPRPARTHSDTHPHTCGHATQAARVPGRNPDPALPLPAGCQHGQRPLGEGGSHVLESVLLHGLGICFACQAQALGQLLRLPALLLPGPARLRPAFCCCGNTCGWFTACARASNSLRCGQRCTRAQSVALEGWEGWRGCSQ